MSFMKYKETLASTNAKNALSKIITIINDSHLTVEEANNVLDLAMASIQTGKVIDVKIPEKEDISYVNPGHYEVAGRLIRNSHLRGA